MGKRERREGFGGADLAYVPEEAPVPAFGAEEAGIGEGGGAAVGAENLRLEDDTAGDSGPEFAAAKELA